MKPRGAHVTERHWGEAEVVGGGPGSLLHMDLIQYHPFTEPSLRCLSSVNFLEFVESSRSSSGTEA